VGEAHQRGDDRGSVGPDQTPLTAFQVSVASLFFSLPASEGFLTVERLRDAETFCRLVVHGDDDLLVDLALDLPPTMPPSVT
jgi:hypothetical protein